MIEFKLSEKDLQKLEVVLKSRRVPLTKHEIRTFYWSIKEGIQLLFDSQQAAKQEQ